MIDGIKICNLPVPPSELLQNEQLIFPLACNEHTGEILDRPRHAIYYGLRFTIKKTKDNKLITQLNGSIHEFFNKGLHNYNDFSFEDVVTTIIDLCKNFKINPFDTVLNNVEFGVNVIVPFKVKKFIDSIISYNGTSFKYHTSPKVIGVQCVKTDFTIKIYDKSFQHSLDVNILRFEISVNSMKYFADKKIKIKYLSDLLLPDYFMPLGAILKALFDKILFYDCSIDVSKLSAKEQLIFSKGRNQNYWCEINPKSKDFALGNKDPEYKRKRSSYNRKINQFRAIINKYSSSTVRDDVSNLIEKKCLELSNYNETTRCKLTDFYKNYEKLNEDKLTNIFNNFGDENKDKLTNIFNNFGDENKDKLTDIESITQTFKKGQNTISTIVRLCPITNLNISMQKHQSIFLCITGIKFYYNNQPDIYKKLFERLSPKCKEKSLEIQFKEIAHSIRNEFYNNTNNSRNNLKKRIRRINELPVLFETNKFLKLSEEHQQILSTKTK